jgi:hypothetical protein
VKSNKRIDRIASIILADDYKYIYDPDHRNKPRDGEFYPTEKGWSNDPKDNTLNEYSYGIEHYPMTPQKTTDYSKFKYRGLQLTDEQRAEYPSITLNRGEGRTPIKSSFIGGKDSVVSPSEAKQINDASKKFLQYAQMNEEKYDNGEEVATYVEDEIPRAIRKGISTDIRKQSFSFHPSEDIIHNIKFFEFLDEINPKLTEKLLDASYIAPHEQTPESLSISDSIHQIDNGDLKYKPSFG